MRSLQRGMDPATRAHRAYLPPYTPLQATHLYFPPSRGRGTVPAMPVQYSDWNLNVWLAGVEPDYPQYRSHQISQLLNTPEARAAYDDDPMHWELTQYTNWQSRYAANRRSTWAKINRQLARDDRERAAKRAEERAAERKAHQDALRAHNAQTRAESAYAAQQRALLWQDYGRTEHRLQQAAKEADRLQRKALAAAKAAYDELQRADRDLAAARAALAQLRKPTIEPSPVSVYQPPAPPKPPPPPDEWAPHGRDADGYPLRGFGVDADSAPHGRDPDGYPLPPPGYVQPPANAPWGQPPAPRRPWDDDAS